VLFPKLLQGWSFNDAHVYNLIISLFGIKSIQITKLG
jgi:hypothetical protein